MTSKRILQFENIYEMFLEKENLRHNNVNLAEFMTLWNTELNISEIQAKRKLYDKFSNK